MTVTTAHAPPPNGTLNANLICMASMLIWAAGLPAAYFVIGRIPPIHLSMLRMSLAALFLVPVWWLIEGRGSLAAAPWLRGIAIGALLATGSLTLVIGQSYSGAVTVAVISALLPIVGMGLEVVFDGRRLTRALVIGISLSLAGGLMVYAARLDQVGLGIGAALTMFSNLCYAGASRLSVTAIPGMTPLGRTALTMAGAAVASILASAVHWAVWGPGEWGVIGWPQIAGLAVFAIGGMAISQLLWVASIARLGIGVSSLHINAAPFYVMIFAWALGGSWSWAQVGGAAVVGLGVLVAQGLIPLGSRHADT